MTALYMSFLSVHLYNNFFIFKSSFLVPHFSSFVQLPSFSPFSFFSSSSSSFSHPLYYTVANSLFLFSFLFHIFPTPFFICPSSFFCFSSSLFPSFPTPFFHGLPFTLSFFPPSRCLQIKIVQSVSLAMAGELTSTVGSAGPIKPATLCLHHPHPCFCRLLHPSYSVRAAYGHSARYNIVLTLLSKYYTAQGTIFMLLCFHVI